MHGSGPLLRGVRSVRVRGEEVFEGVVTAAFVVLFGLALYSYGKETLPRPPTSLSVVASKRVADAGALLVLSGPSPFPLQTDAGQGDPCLERYLECEQHFDPGVQ